jgi:hypothetical protein
MRPLVSLSRFFHKGEKQNAVHFATYCMGCVEYHTKELLQKEVIQEMDDASQLERKTRIFNEGELPGM